MAHPTARLDDPSAHGLNMVPFASMAGGWLGPLLMFWLYVWGPLRPFDYPSGDLLPPRWFLLVIVACFALWWVLPRAYFQVHRLERTGRLYKSLGVLGFRRFVPDGDLANRRERRKDPSYRIVRNRGTAAAFIARTEQSERGHLVLLALGVVSAGFAWTLGWRGWAAYLSVGNVAVNLYPILLQRYTRSRLHSMIRRTSNARSFQAPA